MLERLRVGQDSALRKKNDSHHSGMRYTLAVVSIALVEKDKENSRSHRIFTIPHHFLNIPIKFLTLYRNNKVPLFSGECGSDRNLSNTQYCNPKKQRTL